MPYHIEQLIKRNLSFLHRYGYLNMLPPANLDVSEISHPELFDTRLFQNARDVPVWNTYQGQLNTRYPQLLTTDNGVISLPDNCLMEEDLLKGYADTVKAVLLASENHVKSILVSERTYALSAPYVSNYDKAVFLEEYLDLPKEEQHALFWFLSSPASAKMFHFYAVYFSTMIVQNGSLSEWDIVQVLDRSDLPPHISAVNFDDRDVMALLRMSGFLTQSGSYHMGSALWGILHGVGVWKDLAPAEALLAAKLGGFSDLSIYIEMLCDSYEIAELAQAFTDPQLHDTDPQMCNTILLKLLRIEGAANGETIAAINRCLFAHTIISLEDIVKLSLIPEKNYELLLDDLFQKVNHSLAKGVTDYTKPLALAWLLETAMADHMNLQEIFSDAQEMILDGETDAAMITGMHMLSLLLRYHSKDAASICLQHGQAVLEKIAGWLLNPTGLFYNTAAVLAQDIVCWGGADPAPLGDPAIKNAAAEADTIYTRIVSDLFKKLF